MPKFQERHHKAIAQWVSELPGQLAETDRRRLAWFLARKLSEDNHAFKRGEFMKLCEVLP